MSKRSCWSASAIVWQTLSSWTKESLNIAWAWIAESSHKQKKSGVTLNHLNSKLPSSFESVSFGRDKGTVAPPASSESPVATVVGTVSFEEIKAPQDNETMTVRMGLDLLQCMGVFCGVDFGEDNGHQFFVQNSPFGVGQPKLEVLYTKSCPTCISAKKAVQSAQPAIHHNMPGPTKPKKYNVKNHSNL